MLTVCDVYDVLRSKPRLPRRLSHERAVALLQAGTSAAFDGRCVAALERVLAKTKPVAPLAVAV